MTPDVLDAVRRIVDQAPPLTEEQAERLVTLGAPVPAATLDRQAA